MSIEGKERDVERGDDDRFSPDDAEAVLAPGAIRYLRLRRLGELALVVATLPVTVPIAAVVALAITLDSPGPIFYRQLRPGRKGIVFSMIKFRSMSVAHSGGAALTAPGDPRITRVGRFIRRTRLDELPQLWNVIRGEMSLIGPRPEPLVLSETFERHLPGYHRRRVIPPGLTGWAQVEQGYVDGIDELGVKLALDMHYIGNISPRFDALILLKTIRTMITGAGAR
jgi:lipopolysaccharide/colanic/teichoic acid biosynthesis glycosyltransferase